MLLSILIAVGVGVILAVITGIVLYRANAKVNVVQRQLNRIENKLSAAGATWLADFFADAVVGDVKSLELRAKTFVESDDITEFFLDNVAVPLARHAIWETARYYPDKFDKIKAELEAASAQKK